MPHHWASLRVQFMLLIVLAAVPALGITAYQSAQDRARETISAQANALRLARLASGTHERLVLEAQDHLSDLAQEFSGLDLDTRRCSTQLAGLLARFPVYTNLMAFHSDGTLFCSGVPMADPIGYSESPWFRRVLSARDLVVGDYTAAPGEGRFGQPLALPIRDRTGQISLILMATLDREWLGDLAAQFPAADGTTITVLDRKSIVLTRYPDPARWTGKEWHTPVVQLTIGAEEMTAEGADQDGPTRLWVAVPLGDSAAPLGTVLVGIALEQAHAASTINFWRNVATIAVIMAIALGATWVGDKFLVGRQVSALAQATQALAGGRVQTRTGLAGTSGELGELATSIDQMAEALEQQQRERSEMEATLVESEERYRDLFENASDLILSVAPDGRLLYANRAWRDALGYDIDNSSNQTFFDTIDPLGRADCERMFQRVMSGETMVQIELTFVAKDGHKIQTEGSANCRFVDGQPEALRGIFRDVTLRKQAEAKLLFLSSHDVHTGLYNRAYFEEEMGRLVHSRRLPISIVVADVDGLKKINDTMGHAAGDELLKRAAVILRSSFREEDMIARIGGDEFAVLLPLSNAAIAEQAVTRVRQNIAVENASGKTPVLHLSLGAATASSGELLMESLTMADAAMYADKSSRQVHRDSRR